MVFHYYLISEEMLSYAPILPCKKIQEFLEGFSLDLENWINVLKWVRVKKFK